MISQSKLDWYIEDLTGRWRQGLPIKTKLAEIQSPFQKIEMFDTELWGKMLVIDGKIQACDFDEFVYHEMIAHVAMLSHPEPKRVMVLGGGDGGTLREALRHSSVTEATLVEIDREVIRVCQDFMPGLSSCIEGDSRVRLFADDAAIYIREARDLDVIMVDSSDPEGPSESLFSLEFYQSLKGALSKEGIIALQAGSPFFFQEQLKKAFSELKQVFRYVRPYLIAIPTYPGGTWCLVTASDHLDPVNLDPSELAARMGARNLSGLRYYSPQMHHASLTLPPFVQAWT